MVSLNRALALSTILGAFGLVVVAACSSSPDEAAPSRPPRADGGVVTEDGAVSEDAAPPDPTCIGDAGCFKCEPSSLVDFLNACTDRTCVPFDNVARLPLFKPGQALPPVP